MDGARGAREEKPFTIAELQAVVQGVLAEPSRAGRESPRRPP